MNILFLITVDCDLRCRDIELRKESLNILLDVFREHDLDGHITWFINENDFHLTRNHEEFLKEILERGDSIGVHDHYEKFKGIYRKELIKKYCSNSKKTLENWLKKEGYFMKLKIHRNGSLVQHPEIYAALKDLGYTIVSEIYPGMCGVDRIGYPAFDNRSIPIGIKPYRHDEQNFLDWKSRKGHFIQIPITCMFLKKLNQNLVKQWIQESRKQENNPPILLWLFHPYEILDKKQQKISIEAVQLLKNHIKYLKNNYKVKFTNIEETIQHLN